MPALDLANSAPRLFALLCLLGDHRCAFVRDAASAEPAYPRLLSRPLAFKGHAASSGQSALQYNLSEPGSASKSAMRSSSKRAASHSASDVTAASIREPRSPDVHAVMRDGVLIWSAI